MGRNTCNDELSLDGCCHHTQVIADDEFHGRISDLFDQFKALLFGRNTYDLLHSYWPHVVSSGNGTPGELRLAHILNGKPKHVVSSRALAPDWNALMEPSADAIRTLRDEVEGTVLLVASPTLARSLLQWGLVDEYHIAISPMLAGHGPRFLDGLEDERQILIARCDPPSFGRLVAPLWSPR